MMSEFGMDSSPETAKLKRQSVMESFATWLLMSPASRREAGLPASQKGMAEVLGVSQAYLSQIKKDKHFQTMVSRTVRADFGAERFSLVINALFETATNGSGSAQVSAAKTLLGWYEKDEAALAAEDLTQLSDKELRALAARVLQDHDPE